jgi:DNA-binding CsgD family transcriptional regulator
LQQARPADTAVNTEHIRQVHAELRRLAAGGVPVAPGDLGGLADRLAEALAGGPAPAGPLSPRELDVLAQIALGCTNTEAAQRLSLKPETVKSYLRSAATKLGTHSRHEAVSKARQLRLIP